MNKDVFIEKLQRRIDACNLISVEITDARELLGGLLDDPEVMFSATITGTAGVVPVGDTATANLGMLAAPPPPQVSAPPPEVTPAPPEVARPIAEVVAFVAPENDPTRYKPRPPVGFSITGGGSPTP